MKKALLTLMFAVLSFVTFGQRWTAMGSDTPARPQVELISSSEEQIVVSFSLEGFYTNRVETPNGIQNIISVPKMVAPLVAGVPDLPQFPVPAIIGDRAEMQVSVIDAQFTDFNIEVAPSKGNISRQVNPDDVPYTYGAMYSQDAFYPATQAYLEAPYISRDFRGQNIMVTPFAYNPVTKTLRVITNMTIAMNKVSDNGENQKAARKSNNIKVDPEMKQAYSHRFINFGQTRYDFTEDRGAMLVICPEQYMEAMQPLVDWKNQSGRPCTMVSVAEVGGNNENNIKNFIQDMYDKDNLEFILFVGDYNDITPHSMNGGRSDNWFAMLEGNDYYLEAFVGRFSVESVHDVETHVNKVLYYERDMQGDVSWVNQGLGIGAIGAGTGHFGEDDYQHIDLIRDTLLHYTYANVTDLHQGAGASTSSISAAVNNGVSIINYCNHGSETSWGDANYSNSHVNALSNDYMWPMVISVACLNGKFNHSQPCFGETWLRATNNQDESIPTGAVGGMFSWISQPWIPPQYGQDEMIDILTEWHSADMFNHTMGGYFLNGDEYILDASPSDQGDTHNTWILFGDPSLLVRTDNPGSMNVTTSPSTLLIGMSELTVNAETQFGIATLSRINGVGDVEVLGSAYIEGGAANINFEPLDNVGNLTLTVIGYNKVTEVMDIEVIPADGAFITVNNYSPRFAPVNRETSLSFTLKNVGNDPTEGETNMVLSCENEGIQFVNGETTFGIVGGNETIELTDAFSYIIAENIEDGTVFNCIATMTCGNEVWIGRFNITAGKAIINFGGVNWKGEFVPGETLDLVLGVVNEGHYLATNVVATISTENQYVTIAEPTANIGSIDPEGLGTGAFAITIDPACPETEQIVLNFDIVADGQLSAQGSITLKNSCNVIFDLTDSYGDGWNGASLIASFSDGAPQQTMTISSGNTQSYTVEVGNGVEVTLTWRNGSWDSECSFVVHYEDGSQIVQQSGSFYNPITFTANCSGGSSTDFIDPVENLQAVMDGSNVVLTWDPVESAVAYVISRNGLVIDEVTEPTYIDENTSADFYTYCVVARDAEENVSVPTCVEVQNVLDVNETEVEFTIYPNPVINTLYINGGSQYSYVMYNGMGQQVAAGEASGSHSINVSNMAKGIYFIRLTDGAQVSVQKVVVE